jgi:hypothetical protein
LTRDEIDPLDQASRVDWDLREEGVQVPETSGLDQPLLVVQGSRRYIICTMAACARTRMR